MAELAYVGGCKVGDLGCGRGGEVSAFCLHARARKGVELCCHALGGLGLFERTINTWEVPQVPQVQVGTRYLDKIRWLKKEKEEKKREKGEGVQDMSFARVRAGVVGTVSSSGTDTIQVL